MEKEVLKKVDIVIEEQQQNVVAEYYLIIDNHPFGSGEISYMSYGVGIQMLKNDNKIENTSLKDVFFSKEEAVNFISSLADGKVTPCGLEDVVTDYLKGALM